jgi:hypothetical protein
MAAPKLPANDPSDEVQVLTEEEGWEFLETCAQHYLGIGAHEFVRRWQAGEYPDPDGTPVMHVVMSLPFVGVNPYTNGSG